MTTTLRPALFLDRDGVINERLIDDYVRTPEQFVLLHDIVPILRAARAAGYLLILITNQQGVGKGLMTMADLDAIHRAMQQQLALTAGTGLDAIHVCTDLASAGSPRRKPHPGMLFEAIAEHAIDGQRSWFLGDSITDAQAGRRAGIRTILVGDHPTSAADVVVPDLRDVLSVVTFTPSPLP